MITYIIATHSGVETLPRTIDAVQNQTVSGETVIVVDQAGVDDTPDMLQKKYPDVNTVLIDSNVGHAAALNRGLEQVESKFVAILDDDIHLPVDWAETLISEFDARNDDVALIQPNIVEEDYERADYGNIETFQSCGVLARWEPLADVGFFDEEYFIYRDDYQISAALLNADYRIVGVPSTTTYHDATHGDTGLPFLKAYYETRNEIWNSMRYHSRYNTARWFPRWAVGRVIQARRSGTVRDTLRAFRDGWAKLNYWGQDHNRCKKYEARR